MKTTFKLYKGTYHGFASRGDEKSEVVKKAQESALSETVNFFQAELK